MIFPKVATAPPSYIKQHMGDEQYTGFYYADKSLIVLNEKYPNSFWRLLHELGHHYLCLLPRVEFVYNLNLVWDWIDILCTFRRYVSLRKVMEE